LAVTCSLNGNNKDLEHLIISKEIELNLLVISDFRKILLLTGDLLVISNIAHVEPVSEIQNCKCINVKIVGILNPKIVSGCVDSRIGDDLLNLSHRE